jgi:2-keto-3-deoxy-L-rhamnonate aldolase RhmA
MKAAQILREKIDSESGVTTGMLCTFHFWPGLVEMAMKAGLDYLIIDLEHLTFDHAMVAEACAIGRRENFPILVRPPAAEFTPVRLAMDLGPCGLLIPYVESVETMNVVREAVYMKPRGRRRPGGPGNHWVPDVNYETWKTEVEDDLIILPQIESRIGLENVEAIAVDPLTTAIAVGPYDLSTDLGVCWNPESDELQDALGKIRAAGQSAGKNMWMIGDGPTLTKRGYDFLCLTEPIMFLQAKLTELNASVKDGKTSSDSTSPDLPLP